MVTATPMLHASLLDRVQDAVVVKLDFIRLAQHVSHTNLTQDVRRTTEGVLFMLIVLTMVMASPVPVEQDLLAMVLHVKGP